MVSVFSLIEFFSCEHAGNFNKEGIECERKKLLTLCVFFSDMYLARKDRSRSAINLCPTFLCFLAILGTFFKFCTVEMLDC